MKDDSNALGMAFYDKMCSHTQALGRKLRYPFLRHYLCDKLSDNRRDKRYPFLRQLAYRRDNRLPPAAEDAAAAGAATTAAATAAVLIFWGC